jgi:hypothetical protein
VLGGTDLAYLVSASWSQSDSGENESGKVDQRTSATALSHDKAEILMAPRRQEARHLDNFTHATNTTEQS